MLAVDKAIFELFTDIRDKVKRPWRISEPCLGLGGVRRLMQQGGAPMVSPNSFDIDGRLEKFYRKAGIEGSSEYRLGSVAGDVMYVAYNELEDVDGLVAGCPCTPFASNGKRLGSEDTRAGVFWRILDWAIYLSHRGGLLFIALENSLNTTARLGGEDPFMHRALKKLERELPYWKFDIVTLDLQDFIPHRRRRAWLRGLRSDVIGFRNALPPAMKQIGDGKVSLMEMLNLDLPSCDVDSLSPLLKQNLAQYEDRIRKEKSSGACGIVACFAIYRSFTGVFHPVLVYDSIPPLSTTGPAVFLTTTADIEVEGRQRKLFRFLTNEGRFASVGHPSLYAQHMPSGLATSTTGNAFGVPMACAAVQPLLQACAESGLMKDEGMERKTTEEIFAMTAAVLQAWREDGHEAPQPKRRRRKALRR